MGADSRTAGDNKGAVVTPYSAPSDLVLALERRDSSARQQLCERYRIEIERLIGELGERIKPTKDRDRLLEYALRAVELWLVSKSTRAFAEDTWQVFENRVLLFCRRIFSVSGLAEQTTPLTEPVGEIQSGLFAARWFVRQLDGVGGDSWHYYTTDDSLGIFVADVTSHGLPAHLLSSGLPSLWKTCLARVPPDERRPSRLLTELDRELFGVLPEGISVDGVLVQFVETTNAMVRFCTAGNTAALVRSATMQFLRPGGSSLGQVSVESWADLGVSRTDSEHDFRLGDEFVAATDGLWDQPTGSTSPSRVRDSLLESLQALKPTDHLHETVVSLIENAVQQARQLDDICIVTVRHAGIPGSDTSEADLLTFILRRQDAAAQDEMVNRFRKLVWALTTRILRNHQDHWNDAYQEVWLRVWHTLADWRGGQLKSWIGRIAHNRLVDYSKRIEAEAKKTEELIGEVATKETPQADGNDKSACLRCVQVAIASRPDKERRLMQMVGEGIPHAQIREALGFKQKNFYNVLAEIRKDLAAHCKEQCSH